MINEFEQIQKAGHYYVVKLLLDNGADVSKADRVGNTPLHVATWVCALPHSFCSFSSNKFFCSLLNKCNNLNIVRLLLVRGAIPLTLAEIDRIWRPFLAQNADDKCALEREMALCAQNPPQYRSHCSALIPLAIGLARLDLPVLVVIAICAHFARVNEKLVAEFAQQQSWEIAVLVKKKAKEAVLNEKS